jgi:hypothetical protein
MRPLGQCAKKEKYMPMTIAAALANPLIAVMERDELSGYFRIRLGALETEIEIWVKSGPKSGIYLFTQSHAIKTPKQDAPYWTNQSYNDSAALALDQVVTGLCQHYKWGVLDGSAPEEAWLVPLAAD